MKRLTREDAAKAIEAGFNLQPTAWWRTIQGPTGCAATLMLYLSLGSSEEETSAFFSKSGFWPTGYVCRSIAERIGADSGYVAGLEDGFERPDIARVGEIGSPYMLGVQDGVAIRGLYEERKEQS